MSCGSGIWSKRDGDYGACNQCPPTTVPPDTWTCCANGDISFDIRGKNAKVCTSWSTEGSCEFKQKDVRALQATLQSSGCDGLWAAPLWIAPRSWAAPQHATGEIDVFERGCSTADGYLLSFGESAQYIVPEAWGENGKAGAATALTAYMAFDPTKDTIDVYHCPIKSNPIEVGPAAAGCTKTRSHQGYYRDTAGQTGNGEEYMRLVSDVWNGCEALNCGRKPNMTSSDCQFRVTDIKLQFSPESTTSGSPFLNKNPACDPLWHKS
jgi:hypothetical protein